MAKQTVNVAALANQLVQEARAGQFHQVYLLMGEEPYYPEMVCRAVLENCIDESFKDFNEVVLYGSETGAEDVITQAREFPMMAERRLVVVKEAQLMKDIDKLSFYLESPLDSTVLVILMHGASADKRKSFYKAAVKSAMVLDSPAVRDYEIPRWIETYYSARGLQIDPRAAQLLAESAGADLGKIADETDKLLKNLPEGTTGVSVEDIEKNVGVSRQFSVFELTSALMAHDAKKSVRLATYIGAAAKFRMPAAMGPIFNTFDKILKYDAVMYQSGGRPSREDVAEALSGVSPYFYNQYETASRHYPLPKAMAIMSLLAEYDYKGKGGDGGATDDGVLLLELVTKILNI